MNMITLANGETLRIPKGIDVTPFENGYKLSVGEWADGRCVWRYGKLLRPDRLTREAVTEAVEWLRLKKAAFTASAA